MLPELIVARLNDLPHHRIARTVDGTQKLQEVRSCPGCPLPDPIEGGN